jgi:hypothetical protein
VQFVRVPAAQIPKDKAARCLWLLACWGELDRWILEQQSSADSEQSSPRPETP